MDINWNWINYVRLSVPLIFYVMLLVGLKTLIEKIPSLQQPAYKHIISLSKSTIHLIVIIMVLMMVLNVIGIDIQGIVAGLGLMSFAISFALKDIISGVLARYALLLYRPFDVGDEISIKEISGIVSKMDIRYTTINSPRETYLIPNSEVLASIIVLKRKPSLKKSKGSATHKLHKRKIL